MVDYDPFDPAVKQSPHAIFDALRAGCPVHHHRLDGIDLNRINNNPLVARPTEEFWSVFRYEDCLAVLQDTQQFSRREGPGPERLMALNDEGMLLYADDPAHMLQRRIVNKAFTPRMVDQQLPAIQAIADDLVDGLWQVGEADVMADFAVPMTIRVIASIMGAGADRIDDLFRWVNATVAAFGGDDGALEASFVAMIEMFGFVTEQINERREILARGGDPPDDVLTALITAEYQGYRFSDQEILMAAQQLHTAGFETTSTAIANAVHHLCTHPAERAKLERDWSLLDSAVEESLRYDAPVEGLFVTARSQVEIGDVPIPAGAKVRVVYAAANRDDRRFPEGAAFKVDRSPAENRHHLAFGHGPHACVGAALGRTEVRVALRTLLTRLPGLGLHPARRPDRNTSLIINGFSSLPIVWDPAAPDGHGGSR
jgi:cytochrome P450